MDVRVHGATETARKLEGMGERAIEASPALRQVTKVVAESERALFAKSPWAPLSDITTRIAGDHPVLDDTGALKRSLTTHPVVRVSNSKLQVASGVWYGHFALGTKHQPRRQLMDIRPSDRIRIRAILDEFLRGDLK